MDSGFHFWLMALGFWIQIVNRIPEFRTPEEKNSRIPECDPFTWGKMHEGTQRLFTGSTIPRRDVFSAGS